MDVILADYSMPGMNGIELLKEVTVRWPKAKFIMASGFIDDATRASVEQHKASIILKPYAIHEVIKIITEKMATR